MGNKIVMRVVAGTTMPYNARETTITSDSHQNIHDYSDEAVAMSEKLFQQAIGVHGKWTPYASEGMDARWHIDYIIYVFDDQTSKHKSFSSNQFEVDCNLAVVGGKNIETMIKLATRDAIKRFVQHMVDDTEPAEPVTDVDSGEQLEPASPDDLELDNIEASLDHVNYPHSSDKRHTAAECVQNWIHVIRELRAYTGKQPEMVAREMSMAVVSCQEQIMAIYGTYSRDDPWVEMAVGLVEAEEAKK